MHTSFLVRGHVQPCFSAAPGADDSHPWLWIRGGWISTVTRHVVVPRFHRPRFFVSSSLGCLLAIHPSYQTKAWQLWSKWVGLGRLETRWVMKRSRTSNELNDGRQPRMVRPFLPLVPHRRLQDEPRRVQRFTRSYASLPWEASSDAHTQHTSPTTTSVGRTDTKPPPSRTAIHVKEARRRHTCELTLPSSKNLSWHW